MFLTLLGEKKLNNNMKELKQNNLNVIIFHGAIHTRTAPWGKFTVDVIKKCSSKTIMTDTWFKKKHI